MTLLSANFTLAEFCRSQTAARMGRAIIPSVEDIENLTALVENVMQPIRDLLGVPIIVTSGLRPPWLNRIIGGSPNSQHMIGQACDWVPVQMPVRDACEAILAYNAENSQDPINFDQLIYEFSEWIHVSYVPDANRIQILTARYSESGTEYLNGLV